jgi:transcriptional regulator with XRE-family HTH domain
MSDNTNHSSGLPLGHQIRRLREANGWSLAELARRTKTSAPSLHRYENGWDRFEVATLRRIAGALGAYLEIRLVSPNQPRERTVPDENGLIRLISPLFWDRDLGRTDLRSFPHWVACRVLMYGNRAQASAIRCFYGDGLILEAANARGMDNRTRSYWTLVLRGTDDDASEGP